MKSHFLEAMRRPARLTRQGFLKDLLLMIVPALIWWGLVHGRPYFLQPSCDRNPTPCTIESVNPLDRVSIGIDAPQADHFSYRTQVLSGQLLFLVPALWHATQLLKSPPSAVLLNLAADWVIAIQTSVWNGVGIELSHLITQRPRPFVYAGPAKLGEDPAHYTSFYSGHTSFAAAATVALFLILWSRKAPFWLLALAAINAETLTFLTGIFRVLAARHFISDVLSAAIMGGMIAMAVRWIRREPR